uniref:thioredoxin-disulfide reductase (NADPH) n=1 Tax=Macrostomum lignano TaxID=282301 RepID=A0A1I8GBQ0_9PLAT
MPPALKQLAGQIGELTSKHHVTIFSKTTCPFCRRVKSLFDSLHASYHCVELDQIDNGKEFQDALESMTGQRTVPNVFIGGKHIGGNDNCQELFSQRKLIGLLRTHGYQYDLIVVGGGSGGLAAAKEAAQLGAKVACFDFVTPTPTGTRWGLGGTCVNVGCIPKKLMHQAACLRESIADAASYGWEGIGAADSITANWATLRSAVQDHIGSLNWGYRVQLRTNKVEYQNRWACIVGPNQVIGRDRGGKETEYTAQKILVAVGERPNYPAGVPGAQELGITSDDLFSLDKPPGETVVVGASYVALECAGFLAAMGFKFIRPAVPVSLERDSSSGRINFKVSVTPADGGKPSQQVVQCDTVLFAIGRAPVFSQLGLESAGVSLSKAGRIVVNDATGPPASPSTPSATQLKAVRQLTPAAIQQQKSHAVLQAGRMLARRLYGGSAENCDYAGVPTTVFTPLRVLLLRPERGRAMERVRQRRRHCLSQEFQSAGVDCAAQAENACYMKLVCAKAPGQEGREPILGMHYLGPNAGEVMQGFALGLKKGEALSFVL